MTQTTSEAGPSAAEVGQALAALTALEGLVGQRWSGDAKAYAACVRKVLSASTATFSLPVTCPHATESPLRYCLPCKVNPCPMERA